MTGLGMNRGAGKSCDWMCATDSDRGTRAVEVRFQRASRVGRVCPAVDSQTDTTDVDIIWLSVGRVGARSVDLFAMFGGIGLVSVRPASRELQCSTCTRHMPVFATKGLG